jgi:hypothetical protein
MKILKLGEKVKVKSLEWFKSHCDLGPNGEFVYKLNGKNYDIMLCNPGKQFIGKKVTIADVKYDHIDDTPETSPYYKIVEDGKLYDWYHWMFDLDDENITSENLINTILNEELVELSNQYALQLMITDHIHELYQKWTKALSKDKKCFKDIKFTKELADLLRLLLLYYKENPDFQRIVQLRTYKINKIRKSGGKI